MNIFCVGIGGIGLSAVSQILKDQGHHVKGSDAAPSDLTQSLRASGIQVVLSHQKENLDRNFDLLIYSEAIPETNPERMKAKELGILQISYASALGMITKGKRVIAVTGTHGKTTVTGMLTDVFLKSNLDPSIVIGSKLPSLRGQNFRLGKGEFFLTEACEYRDNFLHLDPFIMLINTLEPDHLDYFKTPERYFQSFEKLAEKLPQEGALILFQDDRIKLDLGKVKAKIIVLKKTDTIFYLSIPGLHNQHNARAAYEVARYIGLQEKEILEGLHSYQGSWRRFEYKGELKGAKLYDDYGHHPTEIRATLQAARELHPDKEITIVFQPHQYSRTRDFFEAFTSSFEEANEVWITDIYRARDTDEDMRLVTSKDLARAIRFPRSVRTVQLSEIPSALQASANPKKVFLMMGAGDISSIFSSIPLDRDSSRTFFHQTQEGVEIRAL